MPEWWSTNGRGHLAIHAERIAGRFEKATGECSYRCTNAMIVHEDRVRGVRRFMISEGATVSEDSRYIYFQTSGRVVEETEGGVSVRRERVRRRGREEARVANR
jgi:hypothetical protein